jgi:hypothetical protein
MRVAHGDVWCVEIGTSSLLTFRFSQSCNPSGMQHPIHHRQDQRKVWEWNPSRKGLAPSGTLAPVIAGAGAPEVYWLSILGIEHVMEKQANLGAGHDLLLGKLL